MSPRGYGGVAHGNPEPIGRALVAKTGENQFLVTGGFCRVDFKPASGGQREFRRVEEIGGDATVESSSSRENTRTSDPAHFIRIWNGDETDWGLDFSSVPQIVRVSLGTF